MYDIYTVVLGDTIDSISKKFNTSPEVIKQLNGYIADIKEGDNLIVPRVTSKYFDYYVVNKGDTLYKIAMDNNINPDLLAQLNGINKSDYIYPNQTILVPKSGTILYITAEGDTLQEVANGFKVNITDFINENSKIYLQPEQLLVYKIK